MGTNRTHSYIDTQTDFMKPVSKDELGSGTFWAMLFCTVGVILYLKIGRIYLDANIPEFYHRLILITLAILSVFTICCAIHMFFVGDKSNRQLRRDLTKQNEELTEFANDSFKQIRYFESLALRNADIVRPRSLDNLGHARRIIVALQKRTDKVKSLLATGSNLDLIDAHELLQADLSVIENCMDSLIGANPIPPIKPKEWFSTVDKLFNEIELDLQRIAA